MHRVSRATWFNVSLRGPAAAGADPDTSGVDAAGDHAAPVADGGVPGED